METVAMETYLLLLYVTLDQEDVIRRLFQAKGWLYRGKAILASEAQSMLNSKHFDVHNQPTTARCETRSCTTELQETTETEEDNFSHPEDFSALISSCDQDTPPDSVLDQTVQQEQCSRQSSQAFIEACKREKQSGSCLITGDTDCSVEEIDNGGESKSDVCMEDGMTDKPCLQDSVLVTDRTDQKVEGSSGIPWLETEKYGDRNDSVLNEARNNAQNTSRLKKTKQAGDLDMEMSNRNKLTECAMTERELIHKTEDSIAHRDMLISDSEDESHGNKNCEIGVGLSVETTKADPEFDKGLLLEKTKAGPEFDEGLSVETTKAGPEFDGGLSVETMKEGETGTVTCRECRLDFSSNSELRKHRREDKCPAVNNTCPICGKVYRKYEHELLKVHMTQHSGELPFKCKICDKMFAGKTYLNRHVDRVHASLGAYICDICTMQFGQKELLRRHKINMHGDRTKKFQCDICGNCFQYKGSLTHHRKSVHVTERQYTCSLCDKSFKAKHNLRMHMVMHSQESKDVCSVCGKSFKRKSSFHAHMRRHQNKRSHSCSTCGKLFFELRELTEHMRIHTGEKPYKCDKCNYSCAIRGNLTKHMKVHDKEVIKPGKESEQVTVGSTVMLSASTSGGNVELLPRHNTDEAFSLYKTGVGNKFHDPFLIQKQDTADGQYYPIHSYLDSVQFSSL